ncbi:Clavaminate synthase-like protein [Ceratobasidium sp. AG-I]|nr:Clavaminate synthase-like protein [Ceratobasidium sp. AG-I]
MHAPSAVEGLAEVFGIVRDTMYGRLWDVVSKKGSTNIAFTNLNLDLHMDLMYLEHLPHIQFLHCIKNQVQGGRSVFVDALKAARDLQHIDPISFSLLTQTPIPFHYENDGHHLHHSHLTIQLAQSPSSNTNPTGAPEIAKINYSPPFQAPLPIDAPLGIYTVLRKFSDLLTRPSARFETLLKPGDCVVFDNRRVLHARTVFWDENAREGDSEELNRWLKGCYVERDDLLNRARGLLAKRVGKV